PPNQTNPVNPLYFVLDGTQVLGTKSQQRRLVATAFNLNKYNKLKQTNDPRIHTLPQAIREPLEKYHMVPDSRNAALLLFLIASPFFTRKYKGFQERVLIARPCYDSLIALGWIKDT
ncbi:hypothetical protein HK102_011459, partial [Quaeritorhiza haematococci]